MEALLGDAQDAVAGDGEFRVAAAVGFELCAGLVKREPVEFDDHALVAPQGIDELAFDEHVGLGLWQVGRADQLAEGLLELGLQPRRRSFDVGDRRVGGS